MKLIKKILKTHGSDKERAKQKAQHRSATRRLFSKLDVIPAYILYQELLSHSNNFEGSRKYYRDLLGWSEDKYKTYRHILSVMGFVDNSRKEIDGKWIHILTINEKSVYTEEEIIKKVEAYKEVEKEKNRKKNNKAKKNKVKKPKVESEKFFTQNFDTPTIITNFE